MVTIKLIIKLLQAASFQLFEDPFKELKTSCL